MALFRKMAQSSDTEKELPRSGWLRLPLDTEITVLLDDGTRCDLEDARAFPILEQFNSLVAALHSVVHEGHPHLTDKPRKITQQHPKQFALAKAHRFSLLACRRFFLISLFIVRLTGSVKQIPFAGLLYHVSVGKG